MLDDLTEVPETPLEVHEDPGPELQPPEHQEGEEEAVELLRDCSELESGD